MSLFAIDPGPVQSAWMQYRDGRPVVFGIDKNDLVLDRLRCFSPACDTLAVEMIAPYGMPVGREVFETVLWIGRFMQRWEELGHPGESVRLVPRLSVKLHLCGSARAKDANVRQALIDRFGPGKEAAIGLKRSPGPLFGVTSHAWAALAVAVTVADELAAATAREAA